MKTTYFLFFILFFNLIAEHSHHKNIPLGIMGGHIHKKGEWMVSYRFSSMHMDGNRQKDKRLTDRQVLRSGGGDFMVTPTNMDMRMHMTSLMYGFTDNLTFMVMVPYTEKEMDHLTATSVTFRTQSSGIGDVKLMGVYSFNKNNSKEKLLLNFGLGLPTGSIKEKDITPMGLATLPYPMQLGSGTVDPIVGLTYTKENRFFDWGLQSKNIFRVTDNSEEYRLGNSYTFTSWLKYKLNDKNHISLKLNTMHWRNIKGRDSNLPTNPNFIPTARTDLRGGTRIDLSLGYQWFYKQHILSVELSLPTYQYLEGPQLEVDYGVALSWQRHF